MLWWVCETPRAPTHQKCSTWRHSVPLGREAHWRTHLEGGQTFLGKNYWALSAIFFTLLTLNPGMVAVNMLNGGGVTNPNKYRRIYISSLSSEGHTLPGLWRNRNSMWRYIKGLAAQSRIVTIRVPLEIRRIILDEKLSEFRSNGPPRGIW